MTCNDCGAALASGTRCAECAAEGPMYAAWTRAIDVPPMWDALATRIRREPPRRRMHLARLAAAAAIVIAVTAPMVFRRSDDVVDRAADRYRDTISELERNAPAADPLRVELTAAIGDAERAANRAPDDPVAVTRLVAAYDAKVRLLREVRR